MLLVGQKMSQAAAPQDPQEGGLAEAGSDSDPGGSEGSGEGPSQKRRKVAEGSGGLKSGANSEEGLGEGARVEAAAAIKKLMGVRNRGKKAGNGSDGTSEGISEGSSESGISSDGGWEEEFEDEEAAISGRGIEDFEDYEFGGDDSDLDSLDGGEAAAAPRKGAGSGGLKAGKKPPPKAQPVKKKKKNRLGQRTRKLMALQGVPQVRS